MTDRKPNKLCSLLDVYGCSREKEAGEGWLEDSISRVAGEGLEEKGLEKEKNQRHFMGFFS